MYAQACWVCHSVACRYWLYTLFSGAVMVYTLDQFMLLPPMERTRLLLSYTQAASYFEEIGEGMTERLLWYEKNYDICYSYWDAGRRSYIGQKNNRVCRFCQKKKPEVTFNKDAHAIPHFLGNNSLFSYEECDCCNEIFSKLEDSFAKHIGLGRTLSGIKGKTKIPSYKSPSQRSRIDRDTQHFKIFDNISDPIVDLDLENKSLKIKETIQPYIPIFVYKALVKIALSVMDSQTLLKCSATIDWVKNLNDNRFLNLGHLKGFQGFLPGENPFKKVAVFLVKRKESPKEEVPGLMLILVTANYFFQIVIPGYVDDSALCEKTVTLHPFPLPFPKELSANMKYGVIDFSSCEIMEKTTRTHTMRFDGFEGPLP